MYLTTSIILIAIVAAFVISSILLKSPEISMFFAAVAGVLVGMMMKIGDLDAVRAVTVLIEGLFTNFDLAIQFICASIFVNIYSNSGSLNFLTRKIVGSVDNKWAIMVFMAIFMMVPGALTGAGSVSIFVMGALVATVLKYMGLNEKKTTAFVFMFAILSAACPPINLWTMMMTAQANMPYVGFSKLLLFPIVIVSVFTLIYLGWGAKKEAKEKILAELPSVPEGMNWFRVILPFAVLLGLFLLSLYKPFDIPVLGVPLMFVLATVAAILCNPEKIGAKAYGKIINDTFEQVFSLVATVISVGALVNVLAATGVKGLIGITFITMPIWLMFILLLIVAPFSQGCMSYGSAILIATPLIFMMNTRGMDTTIVAAALSVIFPIGDCLPPSRIVGRVAIETTGYKGSYMSFLKSILLPCALLGLLGLIMFMRPMWFTWLK